MNFRDYYEVLGVSRAATSGDIDYAWRRLSRRHHPDIQPPGERARAAELYKEIRAAYEVLRHPARRVEYDALGSDSFPAVFGESLARGSRGEQVLRGFSQGGSHGV